jgi:hypothetical protein
VSAAKADNLINPILISIDWRSRVCHTNPNRKRGSAFGVFLPHLTNNGQNSLMIEPEPSEQMAAEGRSRLRDRCSEADRTGAGSRSGGDLGEEGWRLV